MAETGSRKDPSKHRLNIGIPFLAHNYEKFQYELILSRAQKFEILLGRPEFATDVPDEDEVNQEGDEIRVLESNPISDLLPSAEAACSHLPESLIAYLRMDLTVVGNS